MESAVATLHSVDFRFLLPSNRPGPFEHVVLLGGMPGTAERLLETGTALLVSRSTEVQPGADAVIVFGREQPDLRDIARCLQPGGVLYFHMRHIPSLSGQARTRRLYHALAEVGLVLVATYGVRPDFISPRVYIPLEAPGALLWYLRTLHQVSDPTSWLMNKTLMGIGNASSELLSSFVPDVAIVARKPAAAEAATATNGASIVSDPLLGRTLGTDDLHTLLISGQRTIVFPFGRTSTEPLAVIKVPKLASQNRATEDEHQALADLGQQLDSSMASSVPKPLLLLRWRDTSVSVESVMRGRSLAQTLDSWRTPLTTKIEGLRDAARWLSDFHRRTELARAPWDAEQTRYWFTTPTDVYRRTFDETEEERCLFERARTCAVSTIGVQLPLVRQHRDFRPVNIIRSPSGEITVVDWEGYRSGPAFCDLFHFLFQWHASVRRQDHLTTVNSVERLLFEPTEDTIGEAIHDVVATYLSELRLHSALVPLLILYTLLELAIRRAEQQQRENVGTDLRRDNENIEFLAVLAAHRDELFDAPRAGSLLQRVCDGPERNGGPRGSSFVTG